MKVIQTVGLLWSKLFLKMHGTSIRRSNLHKTACIDVGCNVIDCEIGKCSYLAYNVWAIKAKIGSFCSIGDGAYIGGAEHPMDWVSTSPAFENVRNSCPKKRFANLEIPLHKQTIIGHDVWIGHNAVIKQGVTIGNGAVIGSNAVVTKNVPPFAVVGGVPAKLIKFRFSEDQIQFLQEVEWWNFSDEQLSDLGYSFKDINLFMEKYKTLMGGVVINAKIVAKSPRNRYTNNRRFAA